MNKVVLKLGDDISTDIIYPGRFMATVLPSETPNFAFADNTEFNQKIKSNELIPESIIIAGKNFGCGSSREQAASCLKGPEFIIIAKGFARIFLQNSINLGLNTVICPGIEAELNDEIEVKPDRVINKTKNMEFEIDALPKSRQAIINAGGLIPFTRKLLLDQKK
jgi:3-isopropylmalate/(R)-2-methylmalate dehydratase small subunit